MGKSFKNEKHYGPKKRKAGGHFNPRREERQKIRRGAERQLGEIVDKFKNQNIDDFDSLEDYERFRETYENGKNGK